MTADPEVLHALTCRLTVCPECSPRRLEHWEYALFKRSNGHQAVAAVRMAEAVAPRLLGLRPGRYILRKRPVYTGPWEDA